ASDACPDGRPVSVLTRLFFGLASADGRGVSEQAWDRFLETVVTPRFPDGFTVLPGYGQYRGATGTVTREGTRVLLLVHPGTAREAARIAEIAAAYRAAFAQEAVLEVAGPVCAAAR